MVRSILSGAGYTEAPDELSADVVLLNTCAIREKAEERVWGRLASLRGRVQPKRRGGGPPPPAGPAEGPKRPVVGVLGCMAERLKERLLERERLVDVVAGPDAYRDLPRLLGAVGGGGGAAKAVNVQLSLDETYADVAPVRAGGRVDAFVSITRGCNNMCSFCVVPFTRGRERSRPLASILDEVRALSDQGYREVTLLGQNVNSYADAGGGRAPGGGGGAAGGGGGRGGGGDPFAAYAPGFRSVYVPRREGAVTFAELLARVAEVDPEMRVRYTSPHPKDYGDDVLDVIGAYPNISKWVHMPAQSGSTAVLERMRRGYSREAYDALVERIRARVPHASLSTDMIVGFCGETEADHAASLDLVRRVGYDQAFLFAYSRRDRTHAARHLEDDVPGGVKQRRLREVIDAHRAALRDRSEAEVGRRHLVLVEGPSKRDASRLTGRTCGNRRVVFDGDGRGPAGGPAGGIAGGGGLPLRPGDYADVEITGHATNTLWGVSRGRTTLAEFVARHGDTVAERPAAAVGGGA